MTRTPDWLIEERMRDTVLLIVRRSRVAMAASEGAVLSLEELAAALDLTVPQVRCVVRRLVARGLVVKLPRFLPNGGQLENAFLITAAGYAFLWEKGAPCAEEREAPFAGLEADGVVPQGTYMNGAK